MAVVTKWPQIARARVLYGTYTPLSQLNYHKAHSAEIYEVLEIVKKKYACMQS